MQEEKRNRSEKRKRGRKREIERQKGRRKEMNKAVEKFQTRICCQHSHCTPAANIRESAANICQFVANIHRVRICIKYPPKMATAQT